MGASSLGSAYLSSRRSKEEKSAAGSQAAALQQGMQQGAANFKVGHPAMTSALSYYDTLLKGNRAAQSQAVAAPTAQITDLYRGAERGLDRSMVRGGAKDLAMSEMSRDRVGQLSQLTAGVQPMAAANLGQLGSAATGMASGPLATAAQGFGDMNQMAMQNRMYRNQAYGQAGNNIGNMAFNVWKQKQTKTPQTPGRTPGFGE